MASEDALAAPRPAIWGIVNVTPDSFSDGGLHAGTNAAIAFAQRLRKEGADVLDIGGESTRPGADPVAPGQEIDRVVPVIQGLRAAGDAGTLSVDTRRADVAKAALAAGAEIVNDVSGGRDTAMFKVVAQAGAGLVLMHMLGEPQTMQAAPRYDNVVAEVHAHLAERVAAARAAGCERLWIDPGIGFGKTLAHNLALLRALDRLQTIGVPVLLGASRKSFLGTLTGIKDPRERLAGSLACVARAYDAGVEAVRVHDVRETHDLLEVLRVISPAGFGTQST